MFGLQLAHIGQVQAKTILHDAQFAAVGLVFKMFVIFRAKDRVDKALVVFQRELANADIGAKANGVRQGTPKSVNSLLVFIQNHFSRHAHRIFRGIRRNEGVAIAVAANP